MIFTSKHPGVNVLSEDMNSLSEQREAVNRRCRVFFTRFTPWAKGWLVQARELREDIEVCSLPGNVFSSDLTDL